MGLIKKIFGGLFSFIGSLLRLVGIGKSGYYLELDESTAGNESSTAPAPAKAEAQPKASKVKAKAKEQPPVPAGQTALTPAPEAKPVPTPTLVEGDLPVAKATVNGSKQPGSEPTFATDYLVNPRLSNGSRRRPGPSLSPFKDMAKQVKTPV